ncbi:MAG TPA: YoaK family protein [Rhodanobacteraceae bacterium]|nr:YoaK family protein [Rhodanobacteraceae bacterium]
MDRTQTGATTSAKALIAWALAATAGFIDAVGYRTLQHLFTAHMSGNSARLGVFLGKLDLHAAIPMAVAVGLFVFGIAIATTLAELVSRRRAHSTMPLLLGVQMLLLAAFMGYGMYVIGVDGQVADHSLRGFYVLASLAIIAIGFQTCALQHAGGQRARTTYVSGMLTRFSQEFVNWLFWMHDGTGRSQESYLGRVLNASRRTESAARMLLFGGIWCAYLGGAVAGSYLDGRWQLWSLACPLIVLAVVIAVDQWWPLKP